MTPADERAIEDAEIGVRLSAIFHDAERQAQAALQARRNAYRRTEDWETIANQHRETIARQDQQIACLTDDLAFALSAMRVYRELAASLTTVQAGTERLLATLRELEQRQCGAVTERMDAIARLRAECEQHRLHVEQLECESEGRRKALAQAEAELTEVQTALDYFKSGDAARDLMLATDKLRALDTAFGGVVTPEAIAGLRQDRADATEANRLYARTLTAIRGALGAGEDADLVEEATRLKAALDLQARWYSPVTIVEDEG